MSIKTQGTGLWTIDPVTRALLDVGCVTQITGIDSTLDQIETTCLGDDTRTYVAGLATPGTASFTIQFDPQNPVHIRLHQLKIAGTTLSWILGFRNDVEVIPALTTDSLGDTVFDPQPTRSWLAFDGFLNAFPFDFSQNAVVTSALGVQISGEPVLIPKATS